MLPRPLNLDGGMIELLLLKPLCESSYGTLTTAELMSRVTIVLAKKGLFLGFYDFFMGGL